MFIIPLQFLDPAGLPAYKLHYVCNVVSCLNSFQSLKNFLEQDKHFRQVIPVHSKKTQGHRIWGLNILKMKRNSTFESWDDDYNNYIMKRYAESTKHGPQNSKSRVERKNN